MEISWRWMSFSELGSEHLYQVLQLREQVFQIEQNCLYMDIDGFDREAYHCLGFAASGLCAYARVRPIEEVVVIERIVTSQACRGKKVGPVLVNNCLDYLRANHAGKKILISAQFALVRYYEQFGFMVASEPYDEDGIMHIKMEIN